MAQEKILLTFDMEGLYGIAEEETKIVLKELRKRGAYATFFFTAKYAQRSAETIEAMIAEGHEIGCHGLDHYTLTLLNEKDVKGRLEQAASIMTSLSKTSFLGFRAPNFAVDSSVIKSVKMLGFKYDSSVLPSLPIPSWYGNWKAPIYPYHPNVSNLEACVPKNKEDGFWEIPLAVVPHIRLPCFGGWWLRNLGESWFRNGLDQLLRKGPATICLHDWEFLPYHKVVVPADFRSEHSMPPLAFRNTGEYVIKMFKHLLKDKHSSILSIRQAIEKDLLNSRNFG